MAEMTQSAALSALKRADFEAEPIGELIAMSPADIYVLLARASAIQDRIELRKQTTGEEVKLIARCAVIAIGWPEREGVGRAEDVKTLSAIRTAVRRTDVIIRSAQSEAIIVAHKIAADSQVNAIVERLRRVAAENALIGYVRVGHPTRFSIALDGALEAWRRATPERPVQIGDFDCPGVARASRKARIKVGP